VFGDRAEMAARHYYAATLFGIEAEFTPIYYKLLAKKQRYVKDEYALRVFKHLGIKEDNARRVLASHRVTALVDGAKAQMKKHKVYAVPTFIVNGQHKVNREIIGDRGILKTIDELLK
jgi:predicted DsbA family dithiol-disulfide isomerase